MIRAHEDVFVQFLRRFPGAREDHTSPCVWFQGSTIAALRAVDEVLRDMPGHPHEEEMVAKLVRILEPYRVMNVPRTIDRDYVDARSDQAVVVVDITNKRVVVDEMYHRMPFPPASEYSWEQVNLDEDRREHHGITPDQDPRWED